MDQENYQDKSFQKMTGTSEENRFLQGPCPTGAETLLFFPSGKKKKEKKVYFEICTVDIRRRGCKCPQAS